jgi:hypothetical protein
MKNNLRFLLLIAMLFSSLFAMEIPLNERQTSVIQRLTDGIKIEEENFSEMEDFRFILPTARHVIENPANPNLGICFYALSHIGTPEDQTIIHGILSTPTDPRAVYVACELHEYYGRNEITRSILINTIKDNEHPLLYEISLKLWNDLPETREISLCAFRLIAMTEGHSKQFAAASFLLKKGDCIKDQANPSPIVYEILNNPEHPLQWDAIVLLWKAPDIFRKKCGTSTNRKIVYPIISNIANTQNHKNQRDAINLLLENNDL